MGDDTKQARTIAEDVQALAHLGYGQELLRRMSGFSNYAISLSIICILAGGITSFHLGLCSVGGASIGLGWPLACLLSLAFAAAMGQAASAFPTAGGLYHWAAILGGRGWGWATAWFNLAGLITVLAAINVGMYLFVLGAIAPRLGYRPDQVAESTKTVLQISMVILITASQALLNHLGIRVTTLLTDFSGWWILIVAIALAGAMLAFAPSYDFRRLVTFTNYSGSAGDGVWPLTQNIAWLFALGLILPAYTITGFDASAHTSEETVGAAQHAPRGIVRSVLVSGIFGWLMLSAIILAVPNMDEAAAQGENAFYSIMDRVLPVWLGLGLSLGIAVAQYLCGLATITSASRMAYAFARDGGLPFSSSLRRVNPTFRVPVAAIWSVAGLAVAFTIYTPVYSTITTVCVIFLYISYVVPALLGLFAYGRSWTKMGPWTLGRWYRPVAATCVLGCIFFVVIGVQPPNDKARITLAAFLLTGVFCWFGFERRRFRGPPVQESGITDQGRRFRLSAERSEAIEDRRRVAILANPVAGRGPRGHLVDELADELRQRKLEPTICRERDELTALVQSGGGTLRCVVAAGGDGTLNEVINRAPGIPLSILPLGNENLVARQFGLPASAQKLAEAIELASIRRLDLARLGDRYFCLMAGAGIDAAVVHGVHHTRRSHISKWHYVVPSLKSLGLYSFPPIDVEIAESGERLRGAAVFLFNMPQYGLGLPIAPSAQPDDGRLDLWVFERRGVWNLARYLCAVLSGRHQDLPDVQHRLVKQVRLTSEGQVPLQTDGDPAGWLPATIEVVPGVLQLIGLPIANSDSAPEWSGGAI